MMLPLTLRNEQGDSLLNVVFVKTEPAHSVGRVAAAFSKWTDIAAGACRFVNGVTQETLDLATTVGDAGLANGRPVLVYIANDGPKPNAAAAAAPYHVVDVVDSEMAGLTDLLGMAREDAASGSSS